MRKTVLLAIPILAVIAIAGFAVASPFWANPQNMTAEEKNVQLQILNEKQQMIQDQKDYINGVITQQQFQDKLTQYQKDMIDLRSQLINATKSDPNFQGSGCPAGGGHGWGMGHKMGRMMWGY